MCYSAMVEQHLRALARQYRAEVHWELFEQLLSRRLEDRNVKVARALEDNFTAKIAGVPPSAPEHRAQAYVEAFRRKTTETLEQEIFEHRRRLADAQRVLERKQTKHAREAERISRNQIQTALNRLADLKRTEPLERDRRIFPMYFAPVIVQEDARRLVRPMRYTCRLPGKPASDDLRDPGTYNARRDSLRGQWASLYGKCHAIMVISSFFENVPAERFATSTASQAEPGESVVLHFKPNPPITMLVACLWARWSATGAPELLSFAAITDEPPPEIAATGHDRCVIPIKRENLDEWLAPEHSSLERLDAILTDCERPHYEHRIAA